MAISLPSTAAQPLPQPPAQAEALTLRAGQVVEARVVGTNANGTTQLSIGSQLVDAALQVRIQPDTLIQLLVQGSGSNVRLTVLPPAQPQGATSSNAQPQPQIVKADTQPVVVPAPARAASGTSAQAQLQTQPGAIPRSTVQTSVPNARPALVPAPVSNGPAQTALPQSPAGAVAPQIVSSFNQPAQLEPGTVFRIQLEGAGAKARPVLVPTPNQNSANTTLQSNAQNLVPVPVTSPLQQVVTQTVQNAVIRQDSIATLLSSLAGLGAKLADLPKPVAQAGSETLAGRLNLNARPLDGAGLKQALFKSGVLFESNLLKSGGQPLQQGDLKSALLGLRNELRLWLGGESQTKPPTQQPPPPPTSGSQPRAGNPSNMPLPGNLSGAETGARLLGQAEAALARIQLTQLSSLPESAMRAGQGPAGTAPELNMELPMQFGSEMSVGQFQIFKDGGKGKDGKRHGEWKMRFSIHFNQTGEVGATVSFRSGKTGVMLWAEREETAAILQETQGELGDALLARGLEPGTIRCRQGHPPQELKPVGAFMDDCS